MYLLKAKKKKVKLKNLPKGSLFEYNGTIAILSEYDQECYIVDSGELFIAGVDKEQREELLVTKLKVLTLLSYEYRED